MNPFRILLFSALILFMLLVLLVGLHWGDELPPDDADLLPARRIVAQGEDGYPLLAEAMASFEGVSDSRRLINLSDDGSDDEWLRTELEEHEEALRLLAEAIERPVILLPEIDPFDVREGLGNIREMTRLITTRGRVRARAPETARDGLEDFLAGIRLGRLVADGGGALIDLLTGIATQSIALEGLRKEGVQLHLNAEETRTLLQAMEKERIPRHAMIRSIRGEYRLTKEMHAAILGASGHAGSGSGWYHVFGYAIKPNKTLRIIGDEYRVVIDLVEEPVYSQAGWPNDERKFERSLPLENAFGRMMAEITLPSLSNVMLNGLYHEANFGRTRLVLALAAFERATGELPDALDELVPEWIDALPVDPFSGEPLKYSRADRLVFTVGAERVEDPSLISTSGRDSRGSIVPEPVDAEANP